VLVEASADLGLTSRLAAASLASTEAVFHTDDDTTMISRSPKAPCRLSIRDGQRGSFHVTVCTVELLTPHTDTATSWAWWK
jgi:hypothetical protein